MTLASGTRLGPYEIVAPLGAGGMGEVYRAKDTRLGREVAIKVLPAEVAGDAERLRRFEQEAKAASALNHANILTVHDFGTHDGVAYLVTELLAGESLRDALRRGPVAARRAVELAMQFARGLAAAHEKGIVHRDLKPENLFLTKDGGAKILDFGLARVERPERSVTEIHDASTLLETQAGTVLGTAGYMAPEQVRGERADARSDLFSLGVVLHEMLAGANPFRRDSTVESLNAILKEEPGDLAAAPSAASPALARVVARLLEKDPDHRFHSAHDLAFALEALSTTTSGAAAAISERRAPAAPRRLVPIAATALALAAVASAYWVGRSRSPAAVAPGATRFHISPPPETAYAANTVESVPLAVSPDGRTIAFVGFDGGGSRISGTRIWLRPLDELEARPMPGSEDASSITWSPDGRSLAFFRANKLFRIDVGREVPVAICDVPAGIGYAATWGRNGQILFSSVQGEAIYRVPASGGTPEELIVADVAKGELRFGWPQWLPDGEAFLYYSRSSENALELMLVEDEAPPRRVAPVPSRVEFAAPDWLLFVREGTLYAQRFDRAAAALLGTPVAIAPAVRYFYSSAWAGFAASPSGTIAYMTGENSGRLLWFGRDGAVQGSLGEPGDYLNLSISPDGEHVLADRRQREFGTYDLWQIDLDRGVETRLTNRPDADFNGVWMPDGKSVVYSTLHTRNPNLVRRNLETGAEESLLPREAFQSAGDVSRDGRLLLFLERGARGKFQAHTLTLDGSRVDTDLFAMDAVESSPRFSPDGGYVAYLSDVSGTNEAYVAPLSAPNAGVRISRSGAWGLRWSRDGREIFVLAATNEIVSYPVRTQPKLEIGSPRTLFRLPPTGAWSDFDVVPDGRRFLAAVRERSGGREPLSVVVGWTPPAAN